MGRRTRGVPYNYPSVIYRPQSHSMKLHRVRTHPSGSADLKDWWSKPLILENRKLHPEESLAQGQRVPEQGCP